jgi:hypothetical protein
VKVSITANFSIFDGKPIIKEFEVENEELAKEIQWLEEQHIALRNAIITGDKEPLMKMYREKKYCIRFINGSCPGNCVKHCPYLRALAC